MQKQPQQQTQTRETEQFSDLKVLIVGASGHLGSHIVKYLCENHKDEVKLSLLVPKESRQKISMYEDKITGEILTCDVLNCKDEVELSKMLKDFTLVVNCMNFFDSEDEYKAEHLLIQSCIKANVKYYIPSDFSMDFRNVKSTANLPRIEVRKRIHQELNNQSQLKWISILCGVLMEKLLCEECNLVDKQAHSLNYYGTGDEEFEVSTFDDVAKFVSELIARRDFTKFEFKYIPIFTDRITFKQLGMWLKDFWGTQLKMNCLGTIQDLDKKIESVKNKTDLSMYYYLQYMKVVLMQDSRIKEVDNQIWPSITKCGAKNIVSQWTSESGLAL